MFKKWERKTARATRIFASAAVSALLSAGPSAAMGRHPASSTQTLSTAALPAAAFQLFQPGTEDIVSYEKYGRFENLGKPGYRYVMTNAQGLAAAAGEGIYPDPQSVRQDPDFQKYNQAKELEGSHWDYVHIPELQKSFFKWNIAPEDPGVKQYFAAYALERAGLLKHAVKAYHACLVHFPGAHGVTFWNSPWYVGPTALDRLQFVLRTHPELGLRLDGVKLQIENSFNNDIADDIIVCNPGRFVRVKPQDAVPPRADLSRLPPPQIAFNGKNVKLLHYENGHWQLTVNGKPYAIRAMAYAPNPVGRSPDNSTLKPTQDWMTADADRNGRVDGPYDSWVDKNNNNRQDPNEPVVGDLALLKEMGVNTVRIYHHVFNRNIIDDLYYKHGIHVLMGDLLGAYTVGSGADWYKGTDYTDPRQRENMLASVKKLVLEYKDHPGVLMWVLGNENVYGVATNAPQKPEAFFSFANSVAKWIKSVDPDHPVAIASGDTLFLDKFARYAPDIDVFGCNSYRGNHGFGQSLWGSVKQLCDKPVFITEYGCPAFSGSKTAAQAEAQQAEFLRQNWLDIEGNMAGGWGVGNALGGVLFEWLDEWWKAGTPPQFDPAAHDTTGQWQGPFPDGWMYEEWLGVAGQGDGESSPFLRHLRPAYFTLQSLWAPAPPADTQSNKDKK